MAIKIRQLDYGKIEVNDKLYTSTDILLHPEGAEAIEKTHVPGIEEFEQLMLHEPSVVIYGTGFKNQVKVHPSVIAAATKQQIELHTLPTPDAVKKFRECAKQGLKVVARLHLTD